MGVSGFWPFLRKMYPDAFKTVALDSKCAKIGDTNDSKKKRKSFETDFVFIDLNSLVHHCLGKVSDWSAVSFKTHFGFVDGEIDAKTIKDDKTNIMPKTLIKRVIAALKFIYSSLQPEEEFCIACDGIASIAKARFQLKIGHN